MTVAQNADGRMEVFALGRDNALLHIWQRNPNQGWTNEWQSFGGSFKSYPAVGRNGDGRLEVFAISANGALWHIWQTAPNNGWSGWHALDGILISAPVVGHNTDGTLEVFGVGQNHGLWHKRQGGPIDGWWDWEQLGGEVLSDIGILQVALFDVSRNDDGRLEAFAKWSDGTLRHNRQREENSRLWEGWASLGMPQSLSWPQGGILEVSTEAGPAAARNADGRLEVFTSWWGGGLHHIWQTAPNNGWSGWDALGSQGLTSGLAVSRNADGRLEVFSRAETRPFGSPRDELWHTWQGGPIEGWSAGETLPGVRLAPSTSPSNPIDPSFNAGFPTVGQNADGRLEVFVRSSESGIRFSRASGGEVDHIWQEEPNRGWSGWTQLGNWHASSLGRGLIKD